MNANSRSFNKSPDAISANIKRVLKNKDEKLRKLSQKVFKKENKELTFKPSINKKSDVMMRQIVDRSMSGSSIAMDRLHREAYTREKRREECKNDILKATCPFKPITNVQKNQHCKARYNVSPTSALSVKSKLSALSDLSKTSKNLIKKKEKIVTTPLAKKSMLSNKNSQNSSISKAKSSHRNPNKNKQIGSNQDSNNTNYSNRNQIFDNVSDTSMSQNFALIGDLTTDPKRFLSKKYLQQTNSQSYEQIESRCLKDISNTYVPSHDLLF